MTVPAFPLTRILIITDAWLPQVNGVVRSIEVLVREAPALGVEIEILAADGFSHGTPSDVSATACRCNAA